MRLFIILPIYFIAFSLQAAIYEVASPESRVIGDIGYTTAAAKDSFSKIARQHGLGFEEMGLANPDLDAWLLEEGAVVTLPTRHVLPIAPHEGIVINVAEYRLYYFDDAVGSGSKISTFPISIGRQDWLTPLGKAKVVNKRRNPTWFPPKSVIAEHAERGDILGASVPPGPENPLGSFSMRLSIPGYLIHGTNKPAGVGMQVTHGCIRMYPENIEWLFPKVPIGTPVMIVNQPYKFAYIEDELFLQAFPPLESENDEVARSLTRVMDIFVQVVDPQTTKVDWDAIEYVYQNPTGLPVLVGKRIASKVIASD